MHRIRFAISLISLCLLYPAWCQMTKAKMIEDVEKFRNETDIEFANEDESPLPIFRVDEFTTLPYYPIDTNYYVIARFIRSSEDKPFKMRTSTDRIAEYSVYGKAYFIIDNDSLQLTIYESISDVEDDGHLFLPFSDLTSGNETYGGGRYVSVKYPSGDTLFINFNKAYNPYCAYSDRYSCPLVPRANRLSVEIKAGVKYEKHPENWGVVDQKPEYPGGPEKLYKTIFKQLSYPKAALNDKLEGVVYVGLLIDKKGAISKREVLQGFDEACDKVALNATKALKKFEPAIKDGKAVREMVVVPIRFKL